MGRRVFVLRTVGITGPSGSGKSLLCEYIKNTGVPCIDADALYHSMLTPHAPILQAIADAFGAEVLNPDGSLNRQVLGACVFGDKEKLERLNATVLPFVIAEIRERIGALKREGYSLVALDAPTLIESGFYRECDLVVSVIAPSEIRIKRIAERDSISIEKAIERVTAQHSDDFYTDASDITLINDCDQADFARRALEFATELKNLLSN